MARHQVFAASALIAAALAVSAPAQAASSFSGNGTQNIVNGKGAFSDSQIPSGTFTDVIEFTVPNDGKADVGLFYFESFGSITGLKAFFNNTEIMLSSTPSSPEAFSGSLRAGVLAGLQKITVTGTSLGEGTYSGNVKFRAVPELATWLMMIAGVGFTGVALRRRQTAYKVNYAF